MHIRGMGCSTSECIKCDAAVTDWDGMCENWKPLKGLTLGGPTW